LIHPEKIAKIAENALWNEDTGWVGRGTVGAIGNNKNLLKQSFTLSSMRRNIKQEEPSSQ
jgi:hypothetical protein